MKPPYRVADIPISPDIPGVPTDVLGLPQLDGSAGGLAGAEAQRPDITAPPERGHDVRRALAEVATDVSSGRPPEAGAGGGDVPKGPDKPEVPGPDEEPEFQGACFGADVLEKVIGTAEVPPRTYDKDGKEIFDERRAIVDDARRAIKAMRDNNKRVADAVGIKTTDEEFNEWKPDVAGLAKLQKDLAPMRRRMRMVNGAATYIEDQVAEAAAEGIRLRPHQQDVAKGYRDFLLHGKRNAHGGKSGLIIQPTGTGKTREMVETVAMVRHEEDPNERSRVLIVTPTNKLQEQTVGADGQKGFGKFMPNEDIGRYDEDTPQDQREAVLQKDTVAICRPSFIRLVREGKLGHFDKVIVDEVHTMANGQGADALMEYGKDKIVVGCTATPDYDKVRTARNVCPDIISEMNLPEAANRGLVAPIRGYLISADPVIEGKLPDDPAERRAALREAQMEGRVRAAIEIIKDELKRGYEAMEEYCREKGIENKGIGVVVRCKPGDNVANAYEFAKRLRGMFVHGPNGPLDLREIKPAFVGGDAKRQTKDVRDQVLGHYSARDINVLANVKYLEMGWDDEFPKVWIDVADGNEVDIKQGMGRAVRLMRDENGDPILGPNGKPIEARAYSFVNPERGDKQYTVLNALGTKSGELLDYKPGTEAPIPKPRSLDGTKPAASKAPEVEVRDVITATVGTVSLESTVDLSIPETPAEKIPAYKAPINPLAPSGWPNQSGLDEFAQAFPDERVPVQEGARLLGVSAPTYKGIIKTKYGDVEYVPTVREVKAVLEENPLLQAPPQPTMGYTEISPRDLAIRRFARANGVPLSRFTREDGMVGVFMSDGDLARLLQVKLEQEQRTARRPGNR